MPDSVRRFLVAWFIAVALYANPDVSFSQIVVEDSPLMPNDILVSAPLIGYRAFPKSGFVYLDQDKVWAVKGSVFYDAAAADTNFQHQVGKSAAEIKSLPLNKVVELYQKAAEAKCDVNSNQKSWSGCALPDQPNKMTSESAYSHDGFTYSNDSKLDATVVRRAFETGAFENQNVGYFADSLGASEPGMTVKPAFAKLATSIYSSADKFSTAGQNPSAAFDFGDATKVAVRDRSVGGTTAVVLDTVDIGNPLILTAAEERLQPPASILRDFDVFLVQLALNPKEDLRGKFDELSFFVSLQTANSETLELMPIRFGEEQEVKTTTGIPGVKVQAGGVGIELGQIYGQDVTFKTLKPTIVGTGIQASKFGWTLSNEMLDMSAKRLIAVIGVPKGSRRLDFDMVISVKTNSTAFGFIQGNVASSVPQKFSASLPRPH